MIFNNESVFFFSTFLSVDLIGFNDYEKWLHNVFLADIENENDLLLELESATNSIEKTLRILNEYLYDKLSSLDFRLVGEMITLQVETVYASNHFTVEELSHKLYELWCLLPSKMSEQEPFHMMTYIDDPLSWGDKQQTIKLLEQFINYYK